MEGQAADQVIRLILDGSQMLLRVTGRGVERVVAFFAALQKASKADRQKVLDDLNSGGAVVLEMKTDDHKKLLDEAKRWGIRTVTVHDTTRTDGNVLVEFSEREAPRVSAILKMLEINADVYSAEFGTVARNAKTQDRSTTSGEAMVDEIMKDKEVADYEKESGESEDFFMQGGEKAADPSKEDLKKSDSRQSTDSLPVNKKTVDENRTSTIENLDRLDKTARQNAAGQGQTQKQRGSRDSGRSR